MAYQEIQEETERWGIDWSIDFLPVDSKYASIFGKGIG
jgi:hypothetical protein